MNKLIERKTFTLKVEEVTDDGIIKGYASTFGNVDLGMDVVDKGAFKKSIKESNGIWPILADHNPSNQIGWNMIASEDEKGLYVEGKIDLNVQSGKEKFSLAKTAQALGAKMGLSIGYMVIKAEPDRANPIIRHLKELKMFEYSIVTFPMNTEAAISSAKSLGNVDKIEFYIKELESQGIERDEILRALEQKAAPSDDSKTIQSIDELIAKMKE